MSHRRICMRALNGLGLCGLGLVLGAGTMAAQDSIESGLSLERLQRIGTKLQEYVDAGRLPGAVALVYRRGQVVDVQAVGWQDREQQVPVQRDTIFRLASMTKPITAVAAMMLVDEGKMSLHDPVDRWLPELSNRRVLLDATGPLESTTPSPRPITVRDLLMYRIGLGMNAAGPSAPIMKALAGVGEGRPTGDEWLTRLGTLPLAAAPGDRWIYNVPSQVLGILVARVSGMPFATFLQQRIFEPLGMTDTGFWVQPEKRDRLGVSYSFDDATGQLQARRTGGAFTAAAPPTFPSASGGLVSTADDYLRFARMLLQHGEVDGVRLLSPKAVEVMTADYMTTEDRARANFGDVFDNHGFGYGLAIVAEGGDIGPSIGSFHWDGASGASWMADPQEGMITIVLMQQYNYWEHSKVIRDVRSLAYSAIVN